MSMNKAYVFAADPNGNDQLAGTLESDGFTGKFSYADTWLAQPWSYSLDPVNLPLSPKTYRVTNKKGVHAVFSDAGPDDWGTRIMLMHNTSAPANELERLLRTSGGGVGCLRFSGSRTRPKRPKPLPSLGRIQELVQIADRVQGQAALTEEELALIDPGSSLGGARPKVSCQDDAGNKWLVKLSRKSEIVNIPRLEYAAMTFCSTYLGIDTPECRLLDLNDERQAFMIKRFDDCAHFISAYGLINEDRIRQIKDSRANPYSYLNIAAIIRKHSANYEHDCNQLFRRMCANILMGNTDDHSRNHALLFNIAKGTWGLSPAYDMLPSIGGQKGNQALGVGRNGSESTRENALTYCRNFLLDTDEAASIYDTFRELLIKNWSGHAIKVGVWESDLEIINKFLNVAFED